jgi:hypothetical protein
LRCAFLLLVLVGLLLLVAPLQVGGQGLPVDGGFLIGF